jgi:hypothetical protein
VFPSSFTAKVFFVTFVGTHVPLIAQVQARLEQERHSADTDPLPGSTAAVSVSTPIAEHSPQIGSAGCSSPQDRIAPQPGVWYRSIRSSCGRVCRTCSRAQRARLAGSVSAAPSSS